jgi:hypothetical protein
MQSKKTQVMDSTIMILKFKDEKKYEIKQVRGKFNILSFWRKTSTQQMQKLTMIKF